MLLNLSSNSEVFSLDEISRIKQIDGVQDLGRFSRNHFPVTVHIWPSGKIGFGAAARADLFFESIDRFLDQIPEEWGWEENDSFVPIMVPKFYLDLWNFGLAPARHEYPALSRETAKSMPIEIFLGENGSKKMIGRFVAFSKRINSVLVPEDFLQWANQKYATEDTEKYFFTWEGGQINGPPLSRTELKALPDQKLKQLLISSLEEPEKKQFFHDLNDTTSSTSNAARLIVQLNDDYASDSLKRSFHWAMRQTERYLNKGGYIK